MKKLSILLSFLFIFSCTKISAQVYYSGSIGNKYSINLLIESYTIFSSPIGVYAYNKYNTPILLSGKFKDNTLTLTEKDDKGNDTANFVFQDFTPDKSTITGYWIDLKQNKKLTVNLKQEFSLDSPSDYGDEKEWQNREIIQTVSLADKYFKVIVSKNKGDFYPYVSGVKILDKQTNLSRKLIPNANYGVSIT